MSTRPDTATMVDVLEQRGRIESVVMRYAEGLDSFDRDAVRSVFATEVIGQYGANEEVVGADALMDFLARAQEGVDHQHHLVEVYRVGIRGNAAEATAYLVSTQTGPSFEGPKIVAGRYDLILRDVGHNVGWTITRIQLTHRRVS